MRISVLKQKIGLKVYKETTLQSIIRDAMTILVIIVLFTAATLFKKFVGGGWLIEVFIVTILALFFMTHSRKEKNDYTK